MGPSVLIVVFYSTKNSAKENFLFLKTLKNKNSFLQCCVISVLCELFFAFSEYACLVNYSPPPPYCFFFLIIWGVNDERVGGQMMKSRRMKIRN